MFQKNTIIDIRQRLGISEGGLLSEKEALVWYRNHFRQAKGKDMWGTFGFQYDPWSGLVNFAYKLGRDFLQISAPQPLDDTVPLDREVLTLAKEMNVPEWAAPALRLVLLVGKLPEEPELRLPEYLIVPLGGFRVLVHPVGSVSLRPWRKIGEMMGLLPGEIDMWKVPGTITSYGSKRKNRKEWLYWQTLLAHYDAIYERRKRGQKGKRGLLIETAKILEKEYGWEYEHDSYTIRRYLDRAEKIWHFSTP
ncbi:hypothetical protein ES707_21885 [subsurface metagenome]